MARGVIITALCAVILATITGGRQGVMPAWKDALGAEGVVQVRPGDRVLAMIDWGGLAEQVVTPVHTVWPVPEAKG